MPTIPLWMALGTALLPHWSPIKVYFGITIILSIVGWCSLARVVRGKLLQLKEVATPKHFAASFPFITIINLQEE